MSENAGTLELIANELASALKPLEQYLSTEGAQEFIAGLGLRLPPTLATDAQLLSAIATAATSAGGLGPLIVALTNAITADDTSQIISSGVELLIKVAELINALVQIGNDLNAIAGGASLTPAQVAQVQNFATCEIAGEKDGNRSFSSEKDGLYSYKRWNPSQIQRERRS